MNINLSVTNCLTRYRSNALTGRPGPPDGQNIPGHTDLFINGGYDFVNANTCTF